LNAAPASGPLAYSQGALYWFSFAAEGDGGSWQIASTDAGPVSPGGGAELSFGGLAVDGQGRIYTGIYADGGRSTALAALSADGGWEPLIGCEYGVGPIVGAPAGGVYFDATLEGTLGGDAGSVAEEEFRWSPAP
jgi:hypothetical protein